jgi:hypothetical protein
MKSLKRKKFAFSRLCGTPRAYPCSCRDVLQLFLYQINEFPRAHTVLEPDLVGFPLRTSRESSNVAQNIPEHFHSQPAQNGRDPDKLVKVTAFMGTRMEVATRFQIRIGHNSHLVSTLVDNEAIHYQHKVQWHKFCKSQNLAEKSRRTT